MNREKLGLVIIFLIYWNTFLFSQWQQDVRLTFDPIGSYTSANNDKSIAASGDTVHVVWHDFRSGLVDIYYKRSIDGGINWGPDIRLSNNPGQSADASISISGSYVNVVWDDNSDGNLEIYFIQSTNGGTDWGFPTRLTNNSDTSRHPTISTSGQFFHLFWEDYRDGNLEIYYKCSTNSGISWEADIRLTNNPNESHSRSSWANGSIVHVVWYDSRDGNYEIYYKRSTDNGITWGQDLRLTNNPSISERPTVSASGSNVHVVWGDMRDGNWEIYYKRSIDGGLTWGQDVRLTNNPSIASFPSMQVSGTSIHLVWVDNRDGNDEIYYKKSSSNGTTWETEERLTNNLSVSNYPFITVSSPVLHTIWADSRAGDFEIFYKRNPNGNIAPPNQAPILQYPPNNSTDISLTPLLDWDTVANSTSFQAQISIDSSFIVNIIDTIVSLSWVSVPTNKLINNTRYFWRVCGSNSGGNGPWSSVWNFRTLQSLITSPMAFEKWISGENDTIRWSGTNWSLINIKLVLNLGTPLQSNYTIALGVPNGSQSYIWSIPENFLSFRSKIIIENSLNPLEKIESDIFRLKPYFLTKINSDSTYYEYRKDRDQWGFSNDSNEIWNVNWYNQFNYQGIDPFTQLPYPQWQGLGVFKFAKAADFPDWVSWVNTFSVNSCYINRTLGVYSPIALLLWFIHKHAWDGSCFGIATTNAIIFRNKNDFAVKYPNFPTYSNPIEVTSNNQVIKTISEIFTHQYGQPHWDQAQVVGPSKTPVETLHEIKSMLLNNEPLRTLTIKPQRPNTGGHTILPYRVTRQDSFYFVYVYDNSNPTSNYPIRIDTQANQGNGTWSYPERPLWGGNSNIFLMDLSTSYLTNPTFFNKNQNTFIVNDSILRIYNSENTFIRVQDFNGNVSGYFNDSLIVNIPGSFPIIIQNGAETPPLGYQFTKDKYTVTLKNFLKDTISTFFQNGNKLYGYQRTDANQFEVDKIYFDNGLTTFNPDTNLKDIQILSLIDESIKEKLLWINVKQFASNDSIKFMILDSNLSKISSYATTKNYDIELNYAVNLGWGRFGANNLTLPSNSSHIFVPHWSNLNNSQLIILVDLGNNGSIDDTLRINNQIIGLEQQSSILPSKYNLEQNYPNPFNPVTTISFDIIKTELVKLTIYDVLGKEISVLINQNLDHGRYKVKWDAEHYSSGIYFYKIETPNFKKTKKMILLK